MKLIDPCKQCFVMPMCRIECIKKEKYKQSIEIRNDQRMRKFFIVLTGIGIIEIIITTYQMVKDII